jgi:hypothetical protein
MEKLMIAGIIALFSLMLVNPSKPWLTPHDPGPAPVGPTIENPVHQQGGSSGNTLQR